MDFGSIIGLSLDGRFATVKCNHWSGERENISIECVNGLWANNRCQQKGENGPTSNCKIRLETYVFGVMVYVVAIIYKPGTYFSLPISLNRIL